jgi:hypothetical protein
MHTSNEILTLKCRITRIIRPEKHDNYILFGTTDKKDYLRQTAKGKYIVNVEDMNIPEKGWINRLRYQWSHRTKRLFSTIIMASCSYSIGDIIEISVIEILEPTNVFTTEMDII